VWRAFCRVVVALGFGEVCYAHFVFMLKAVLKFKKLNTQSQQYGTFVQGRMLSPLPAYGMVLFCEFMYFWLCVLALSVGTCEFALVDGNRFGGDHI
jgi:hypothetical protein